MRETATKRSSRFTFGKNEIRWELGLALIAISPVTVSDIDFIEDVAKRCGLSYWARADYLNELDRDDSIFFKATRRDDRCLGFIVGRLVPGLVREDKFDAEIYNIGVLPNIQNSGIGSCLMGAFLTDCRDRSVGAVWLEVRRSNSTAIAFYSKHGFDLMTVRRTFYRDPVEDAIVMKSTL